MGETKKSKHLYHDRDDIDGGGKGKLNWHLTVRSF